MAPAAASPAPAEVTHSEAKTASPQPDASAASDMQESTAASPQLSRVSSGVSARSMQTPSQEESQPETQNTYSTAFESAHNSDIVVTQNFATRNVQKLKDQVVYVLTAVNGRIVLVKTRASSLSDSALTSAKRGANNAIEIIDSYTLPVRSKTMEILKPAQQRVLPYYIKVHDGVAHIVAQTGERVVVIQTRLADTLKSTQMTIVDSTAKAQAVIGGYMSPITSRAVRLRDYTATRIELTQVTLRNGVLRVKGSIEGRLVAVKARVSEAMLPFTTKVMSGWQGAKEALASATEKADAALRTVFEQFLRRATLIQSSVKDGYLTISAEVNKRFVILRVKLHDFYEYIAAVPKQLLSSTRVVLTDTYTTTKAKLLEASSATKARAIETATNTRSFVGNTAQSAKEKTANAAAAARTLAGDRSAQVSALSAAGGAVTVGAGTGAAGLVAGSAIGVAVSLPAALFTFGLSIPIGAAVGGGAGLCIGTAAGGTAGFVAGGAAGYGTHKHKDEISKGVRGAITKASDYKNSAISKAGEYKESALSRAGDYKNSAVATTGKLYATVLGSTGSTVA